jgi:hypothetical protein
MTRVHLLSSPVKSQRDARRLGELASRTGRGRTGDARGERERTPTGSTRPVRPCEARRGDECQRHYVWLVGCLRATNGPFATASSCRIGASTEPEAAFAQVSGRRRSTKTEPHSGRVRKGAGLFWPPQAAGLSPRPPLHLQPLIG